MSQHRPLWRVVVSFILFKSLYITFQNLIANTVFILMLCVIANKQQTEDAKLEADNRSIFVGNVSVGSCTILASVLSNGISYGI